MVVVRTRNTRLIDLRLVRHANVSLTENHSRTNQSSWPETSANTLVGPRPASRPRLLDLIGGSLCSQVMVPITYFALSKTAWRISNSDLSVSMGGKSMCVGA
jgi:hypothetical protein